MLSFFQKRVSAEEWGHGLWIYVCDASEIFCRDFQPKLQLEGHLKNSNEIRNFQDEAIMLHMWIITHTYAGKSRNVLDALHNHANMISCAALVRRYEDYENALAKWGEMNMNGVPNPVLGKEALKHFIACDSNLGFVIVVEIDLAIHSVLIAAKKAFNP